MSPAFPQAFGFGSVAGTAVGTLLMAYAGYSEAAVYVCAAGCGCLFPLILSRFRALAARTRRRGVDKDRAGWNHPRAVALGR